MDQWMLPFLVLMQSQWACPVDLCAWGNLRALIKGLFSISDGPANLLLLGPDTVTIGVPASFLCLAQCSPKCSYTIGSNGQSGEGNELAFVLRQWESVNTTVTCTAKSSATGSSSSISKTVRILGMRDSYTNFSIWEGAPKCRIVLYTSMCVFSFQRGQ